MTTPYSERMDRWRVLLKTRGLDAALVTGPSAVFYLTGFRSDPMERFLGLWVPADGDGVLFVPQLDVAKAEQAAVGHRIIAVEDGDSPTETLRRECGDAPFRCGVEKNRLSWRMSEKLAEGWPDTDFRDIGADLAAMIGRKTREEADCVRTAAAIGDRALEDALGDFRRGMKERSWPKRSIGGSDWPAEKGRRSRRPCFRVRARRCRTGKRENGRSATGTCS